MRVSAIFAMLGLCGLLSTTGCAAAQLTIHEATELKKNMDAAKKGDKVAIRDVALYTAVKAALSADATTRSHMFNVEVKKGVVHLYGSGPGPAAAKAEVLAKAVPAHSGVENHINGGKGEAKGEAKAKVEVQSDPLGGSMGTAAGAVVGK